MAASTITITGDHGGTYTFITLRGQQQALALVVDDVTRPGVDGQAFRKNATRAKPFDLVGVVDCDDFDGAQNFYEALLSAQGTAVTFTDDYNEAALGFMLLEVTKESLKPLIQAAGGLSTQKKALLTVRLRLQSQSQ